MEGVCRHYTPGPKVSKIGFCDDVEATDVLDAPGVDIDTILRCSQ